MDSHHYKQVAFLGIALLLAVTAITVALQQEAIAGPLCSTCNCSPAPCGNAVSPNQVCGSTGVYCDGSPGTPTTCGEYCTNTAAN